MLYRRNSITSALDAVTCVAQQSMTIRRQPSRSERAQRAEPIPPITIAPQAGLVRFKDDFGNIGKCGGFFVPRGLSLALYIAYGVFAGN